MTALATFLALALPQIPPEVEIAAWAVVRGVPVGLALAVHEVESGHVPEEVDDADVALASRWIRDGVCVARVLGGRLRRGDCLAGRIDGRVGALCFQLLWRSTPDPVRVRHSSGCVARVPSPLTRDTVRGPGGVGRMQVHPAWGRVLRVNLRNRHVNIAVGVALLAECLGRCGSAAPRCYQSGRCVPSVAGDRYQRAVEWRARRYDQRRW